MAYIWTPSNPLNLRIPIEGMPFFVKVEFEMNGVDYNIEASMQELNPYEFYGVDMGYKIQVRYDDDMKIEGNGINVARIFNQGYDMMMIIPVGATWAVRTEIPDPEAPTEPETPPETPTEPEPTPTDPEAPTEPEPETPTDPEVPVEPETPSTDDGTPATGGDGETQSNS